MKKILLCFTALFLVCAATAQTWCPPGATWHFTKTIGLWPDIDGFVKLVYTGDTTINNIACKIIKGTSAGRYLHGGTVTVNPNYRTYYTYESNHVIFLHNGNAFDTVVNFNASIGDKWLRPGRSVASGCNSRRAFTVTDTGHVAVNGFNLKKVVTTYTSSYTVGSDTYTVNREDRFVERAMINAGGMFLDLFPLYCEQDNIIPEAYFIKFKCYEDNTFPLYNADNSTACESITGIGSITGNLTGVALYPNPATDQLIIDKINNHTYKARLTDLLGNTVLESTIETQGKTQLDISSLNTGIYILQLFEKGLLAGSEKIIKN